VGRGLGVSEWQLGRAGGWAPDVGYFGVSSRAVADRREHERALLEDSLAALGPRPADVWSRYRRAPAFGLGSWLQTWAAGSFQPADVCLATIERFAAAYVDVTAAQRRGPPRLSR